MFAYCVAAGPVSNVLLALVGLRLYSRSEFGDGALVWLALTVTNVVLIWASTVGRAVNLGHTFGTRDIPHLWKIACKTSVAEARQKAFLMRAGGLILRLRFSEALEVAQAGLAEFPEDLSLRQYAAHAHLRLHQYGDSEAICRAMLAEHTEASAQRAGCLCCLAWLQLVTGAASAETASLSAEAYCLLPWLPAIQDTHGLVMLYAGDVASAEVLLNAPVPGARLPDEEAYMLSSLAMVAARQRSTGEGGRSAPRSAPTLSGLRVDSAGGARD